MGNGFKKSSAGNDPPLPQLNASCLENLPTNPSWRHTLAGHDPGLSMMNSFNQAPPSPPSSSCPLAKLVLGHGTGVPTDASLIPPAKQDATTPGPPSASLLSPSFYAPLQLGHHQEISQDKSKRTSAVNKEDSNGLSPEITLRKQELTTNFPPSLYSPSSILHDPLPIRYQEILQDKIEEISAVGKQDSNLLSPLGITPKSAQSY